MARDHHHVVSRGYLRQFAAGETIRIVFKDTRQSKVIGVANTFVVRGINTVHTPQGPFDELEDEWSRLESAAIPEARAAIDKGRPGDAADYLKVLAALHFARSYLVKDFFDRGYQRMIDNAATSFRMDVLAVAFSDQYGRGAEPGELVSEIEQYVRDRQRTNQLIVEQMVETHNKMLAILEPMHTQPVRVLYPTRVELVTGDVPVVRIGRGGVQVNTPLDATEALYMPLSPAVGVSFTTRPQPALDATPAIAQHLNWFVWSAALRQVACHPDADWQRALLL